MGPVQQGDSLTPLYSAAAVARLGTMRVHCEKQAREPGGQPHYLDSPTKALSGDP